MSISYTNIVRDYIDVISQQNETLTKLMDYLREQSSARSRNLGTSRNPSRTRIFNRTLNRAPGVAPNIPSSRVTPMRNTEPTPTVNVNRTSDNNTNNSIRRTITPIGGQSRLFPGSNNTTGVDDTSLGSFINNTINSLFQEIPNNPLNNDGLGQLLFQTTMPFGADMESVPIRASQERINEVMEDISLSDIPIIDGHMPTCPIGLQPLTQQDNIVKLRSCGHIFKKDNIAQWFTSNPCCPVCRRDIREPFTTTTTISNTNDDTNTNTNTTDETSILNTAIDEVLNNEEKDDDVVDVVDEPTTQYRQPFDNSINYIV